uniref:Uncharacterized protein n=1 Tax=Anguilla anguilla TaxID=7936 RepID=A0A0E9PDA1_ANGAN
MNCSLHHVPVFFSVGVSEARNLTSLVSAKRN